MLLHVLGDHVDFEVDAVAGLLRPSVVRPASRESGSPRTRAARRRPPPSGGDGEADAVHARPSPSPPRTGPGRAGAGCAPRPSARRGRGTRSVPTPSTWPWTRCPPSLPSEAHRALQVDRRPGSRSPSADRLRVSSMTSAVKVAVRVPVTVRQTPLIASESPCPASAVTSGPRTVIRAASASRSTPTTSPSSSTIPVNIRRLPSSGPSATRLRGRAAARRGRAGPATRSRARAPPIRTFTVGPGIPPGQPASARFGRLGRVADCHRRLGVSPTPEHALTSVTSVPRLLFRLAHGHPATIRIRLV